MQKAAFGLSLVIDNFLVATVKTQLAGYSCSCLEQGGSHSNSSLKISKIQYTRNTCTEICKIRAKSACTVNTNHKQHKYSDRSVDKGTGSPITPRKGLIRVWI